MRPAQHGARIVDHYYGTTVEILWILLRVRPDLAARSVSMVEMLQPSIRSVLDRDGSDLIARAQVDTIGSFLADLSAAGSDSLRALIADELARVGPLDDYVGVPVKDVLTTVLGYPTNTTREVEPQPVRIDFTLKENFPNPFNTSTTISYELPGMVAVEISVIDILGRQVRVLESATKSAGTYEVSFDATALPSGVYFYRLEARDNAETKRMVVVK